MISIRQLAGTIALTLALALGASAQTFIWTGLGGDLAYTNGGNWQGGVAPTGAGPNLVFPSAANQNVVILATTPVGDITFSGIRNGYSLNPGDGSPQLTLNGNVTTTADSTYWGVFSVNVDLASGTHTFAANASGLNGADLYLFGTVSGSGDLVKTGDRSLFFTQSNTSWTGNVTINQGGVFVGRDSALGTGTVVFNTGTLATAYNDAAGNPDVFLPNNFLLGANPTFGSYDEQNGSLYLGSNELATSVAPVAGVTTVTFHLANDEPLHIDGRLGDGASGAASFVFADGGTYILSGNNEHTGTTFAQGSAVIFESENAYTGLPDASIGADFDGYVGTGFTSDAATFIAKLNSGVFDGVVGFDNDETVNGTIDLSAFHPSVSLGTLSAAHLTGDILPPSGAEAYSFSGHGQIFLEDPAAASFPLTGSLGLSVMSAASPGHPLLVALSRSAINDYSGVTYVSDAALIFDAPGALSGESILSIDDRGYVGITSATEISPAQFVSRITDSSYTSQSIIGFDSNEILHDTGSTPFSASNLDLAGIPGPIYVGTATSAVISGSFFTTADGTGDYYFTGFGRGILEVDSKLTGARALHAGIPGTFQDGQSDPATVQLTDTTNDFNGGVFLYSGRLEASTASALGTGPITVDATATDQRAYLATNGTLANAITIASGELNLVPTDPLEVQGVISGSGGIRVDGNPLTLSGDNTYSGGTIAYDRAEIFAQHDHALGTGPVDLQVGSDVIFETASPSIGSLSNGQPYDFDGVDPSVLTLAYEGNSTLRINQDFDAFFYGRIQEASGVGSIVKAGPGDLTLVGVSTYTGGTTIAAGRLVVGLASALGTGMVTLDGGTLATLPGVTVTNPIAFGPGGGTLGGIATFSSAMSIGANAILSPGNSPGTMTFNSGLTLASGGTLDFEIQDATGAAGVGYDLLTVSAGVLDIAATSGSPFTLKVVSLDMLGSPGNIADFSGGSAYSWVVATSAGGITNFAASSFVIDTSGFANPLAGGTFSLAEGTSGGNPAIFLNFTPIPEPSTYALLAAGLAIAAGARLRRRT